MRIGWTKQDITPQHPVTMGGYGDRKGPSQGVLDRIYARTLTLKDVNNKQVVVITMDLIGLTKKQADHIKDKVHQLTGISKEGIIISTTHTHSGPLTSDNPTMGKADKFYVEWLLETIPETVPEALENQIDCKVGWYQGQSTEVGASRRSIDKKVQPILTVLGFTDYEDELIACLFNYNCHPTVLSAANLKISADYPGAAINLLEKTWGEDVLFAFTNGACGDVSTRFTRRNQDYSEVKRLGNLLAAEVIKGLNKMDYKETSKLLVKEAIFELEARDIPDEEVLEGKLKQYQERIKELKAGGASKGDIRIAHTALQGVMIQKLLKTYGEVLEYKGRLNSIKIGDGVILTQPGELFSSLGDEIMKKSPYQPTMVIGYANGLIGYVPDKESYNEGGYESLSCRFKSGEGERLKDIGISLLKEME